MQVNAGGVSEQNVSLTFDQPQVNKSLDLGWPCAKFADVIPTLDTKKERILKKSI